MSTKLCGDTLSSAELNANSYSVAIFSTVCVCSNFVSCLVVVAVVVSF